MDVNDILIKPVITEKATEIAAQNKYVFRVAKAANKVMIKDAVKAIFSVDAVAVNIVNVRGRQRRVRNQYGFTPAWKKAIVTLKAGDKIELFEKQ